MDNLPIICIHIPYECILEIRDQCSGEPNSGDLVAKVIISNGEIRIIDAFEKELQVTTHQ
jgi:hypothetical protein